MGWQVHNVFMEEVRGDKKTCVFTLHRAVYLFKGMERRVQWLHNDRFGIAKWKTAFQTRMARLHRLEASEEITEAVIQ